MLTEFVGRLRELSAAVSACTLIHGESATMDVEKANAHAKDLLAKWDAQQAVTFSDADDEAAFKAKCDLVIQNAKRAKGDTSQLDRRVKEYESRYEISSEEMRKLWNDGNFRETNEVCDWLMLLSLRDAVTSCRQQSVQ